MFSNVNFNLTGMGYLHDVIRGDGEVFAKINVIHKFNSGTQHSDDVWMNCLVKDEKLLSLIDNLEMNLRKQKTVIVQFATQYIGFDFFQQGLTEDDPSYIVFLKGKLLDIERIFINGVFLKEESASKHKLTLSQSK